MKLKKEKFTNDRSRTMESKVQFTTEHRRHNTTGEKRSGGGVTADKKCPIRLPAVTSFRQIQKQVSHY